MHDDDRTEHGDRPAPAEGPRAEGVNTDRMSAEGMNTDRLNADPIGADRIDTDRIDGETERRLRAALTQTAAAAPAPTTPALDSADIARRARRRRTPRLVTAGAVGCLAVLGLGGIAVQSLLPVLQPTLSASRSADDSATTTESSGADLADGTLPAPLDSAIVCGAPVPAMQAPDRLRLEVDFPAAASTSETISGEVVLTNTGTELLRATSPVLATMALADDGTIAWHTHGVISQVVTELELQPGQAYRYRATVEPVRCTSESELKSGRTSPLPAGRHELVAAIELVLDDGTGIRLVSDPAAILLR